MRAGSRTANDVEMVSTVIQMEMSLKESGKVTQNYTESINFMKEIGSKGDLSKIR